jgi:hypothetical protein
MAVLFSSLGRSDDARLMYICDLVQPTLMHCVGELLTVLGTACVAISDNIHVCRPVPMLRAGRSHSWWQDHGQREGGVLRVCSAQATAALSTWLASTVLVLPLHGQGRAISHAINL